MISTPKLSEAPVETLMMAGVGFVAGAALRVNASLTAAVLAISTIANSVFSKPPTDGRGLLSTECNLTLK